MARGTSLKTGILLKRRGGHGVHEGISKRGVAWEGWEVFTVLREEAIQASWHGWPSSVRWAGLFLTHAGGRVYMEACCSCWCDGRWWNVLNV